jgi:uncharacterized protein YjbI with pentapeptide repeats/flagellar basal body-associated protein FliL
MNQERKNKKKSKPKWSVIGICIVIILMIIISYITFRTKSHGSNDNLQIMTKSNLEEEKLRQEVVKLQIENRKANSILVLLVSNAGLLTALLAIVGAVVTIWKQIEERSRQQKLDRQQRDKDRQQREVENLRRIDEKFTAIIKDLGSDSVPVQAGAAVSILTFLKPVYQTYYEQVFLIILANLKVKRDKREEATAELLLKGFEKAIRLLIEYKIKQREPVELDLSHADLKRVNLSGLDLSNADLGYADMPNVVLEGANLFRVKGYGANLKRARLSHANLNEARFKTAIFADALFHDANLVAANMKETDLRRVQFHQAKLQSAHFEYADLRGAQFNQANINDTFFKDALMDDQALKSILKAFNWNNAHFDDETKTKLENLAAQRK